MKALFTLFVFVCCISLQAQHSNNGPSITVTGEASYDLSPDEININISYQEYFTAENEDPSSKVTIEEIEKKVFASLKSAKIPADKITMGGAQLIRPRIRQEFMRRRINKSLVVCVSNTEEYLLLIRQLEKDGLFEQEVTDFRILQYRHTEREAFEAKCQQEAFVNARAKAERIVAQSGRKLGKTMMIEERSGPSYPVLPQAAAYSVAPTSSGSSGFQSIKVAYTVTVSFELLD